MRSRTLRQFAVCTLLLIVGAACGQKPGVHEQFGPSGSADELGGGGSSGDLEPGTVLEDGSVVGEDGTIISGPGGGSGPGGPTTGGPKAPGPNVPGPSGPGDTTGITDKEIRIGIHAPVTGAAPFPANAFAAGQSIYWDWSGGPKIGGRTVKIFFEDDQYNPTTAVDRCRKMAEQNKVFLLIGGGGTDQIQACARYASSKGVPYLSAGVTEVGLNNLASYFAVSMTYSQQGPLLWNMIKKRPEMGSTDAVAMIYTNTPNFQDARDSFVKAMAADSKTLVLERKMSKNPSSSEYSQVATAIQTSGADIVYILTAPVHYIQVAARTGAAGPWYVGVGVSMGINEVLGTGCQTSQNGMGKSRFFSPFPGIDAINSMDANYNKAYQEKNGRQGDDLGIALWGLNKSLHEMFKATASNLTRQNFISTISKSTITSGVFPPASFTATNRFGGKSVHLLKGNCTTRTYETEARFSTSF